MRRFNPKEIALGTSVEKEHAATIRWIRSHPRAKLKEVARHIALDHLREMRDYYSRLLKMEARAHKRSRLRRSR
jgi:hypothetical protein